MTETPIDPAVTRSAEAGPTPRMSTQFGGLMIAFDERVLAPRAWTVAQSEWASDLLEDAPAGRVLELFAGAGHIGLAAVAGSGRRLVAVDLNPVACDLARRNASSAGMEQQVEVRNGRVDEVLAADETFPVIIADPPWVPTSGVESFPDDLPLAIDGGDDGLDLARVVCGVIDRHLAADGSAVLQLGSDEQVAAVDTHLRDVLGSDLRVVEVRTFGRGVLARLLR